MRNANRLIVIASLAVSQLAISTTAGFAATTWYSCGGGYIKNIAQYKDGGNNIIEYQLDNSIVDPAEAAIFDTSIHDEEVEVIGMKDGSSQTLFQQDLTTLQAAYLAGSPILVLTSNANSKGTKAYCTSDTGPSNYRMTVCSNASDIQCATNWK